MCPRLDACYRKVSNPTPQDSISYQTLYEYEYSTRMRYVLIVTCTKHVPATSNLVYIFPEQSPCPSRSVAHIK